jgi:ATP-dependent protease ClpP protease subunit
VADYPVQETFKERREIMKKLLIISILVIFGCVGPQVQDVPVHKIIVEVKSADPVSVAVDSDKVTRAMEVNNPEGSLSPLTFILGDKAFIKIFSNLGVADVTRLWNDICVLEHNTKIRDVNLFINSGGGDAFSGLALADQIERAKRKGFKITAHASGIIASAAVPVLAVCDVRLASPGTIFMVHEAALWKWPGRETSSDIRAQNELMKILRDRYIKTLVDNSNLDTAEWSEMEKKTTWFSADKALAWGLVDFVE